MNSDFKLLGAILAAVVAVVAVVAVSVFLLGGYGILLDCVILGGLSSLADR